MPSDGSVEHLAEVQGEDFPAIEGFILKDRLGGGAMGTVYLAEDATGPVVIKILRADLIDDEMKRVSLIREASALRDAPAGAAPRLIATQLAVRQPYVVMEYLPGQTLTQQVATSGSLSGDELFAFALGLARSLAALHSVGIVHRDFKPDNIMMVSMLAAEGANPRIFDFGVSDSGGTIREVPSGALLGSPMWMAPEQVMGGPPGMWTDVHGWARAVLYAAKGRAEFDAPSIPAMLFRVVNVEAEVPDEIDDPLRHALRECLSKVSADRPSAELLVSWLATEPSQETST